MVCVILLRHDPTHNFSLKSEENDVEAPGYKPKLDINCKLASQIWLVGWNFQRCWCRNMSYFGEITFAYRTCRTNTNIIYDLYLNMYAVVCNANVSFRHVPLILHMSKNSKSRVIFISRKGILLFLLLSVGWGNRQGVRGWTEMIWV